MPPIRRRAHPSVFLALLIGWILLSGAPVEAAYPRPGTTIRISVTASGKQIHGPKLGHLADLCCSSVISASGRYVAFSSRAFDLTPEDRNDVSDVFLKDLRTGQVERISVAEGGGDSVGLCAGTVQQTQLDPERLVYVMEGSGDASVSANGRYVAFLSCASNLVPGDTNLAPDIFVRDLETDATQRVSVSSSGRQTPPDISIPGTERVSRNSSGTISRNGRYVAFMSFAANLVPDDTNDAEDVFVRDLKHHTTARVSVSSQGEQGTEDGTFAPSGPAISATGRYIAFTSNLKDLVTGDDNHANDVFVRDLAKHTTEIVSVASDGTRADIGAPPDTTICLVGPSQVVFSPTGYNPCVPAVLSGPVMSANGRYVGFMDLAANLVPNDGNRGYDTFVHDRTTGRTTRDSVDSIGHEFNGGLFGYAWSGPASMSADGRYVVFASWILTKDEEFQDDLLCFMTCDIESYPNYIYDRATGTADILNDEGRPATALAGDTVDGRLIVFTSASSRFVVGDTNGIDDVFLHDRGAAVGSIGLRAHPDARQDGSARGGVEPSAELYGASVSMRPGLHDLFVRVELQGMPSVIGTPVVINSAILYGLDFSAAGSNFEVRVQQAQGPDFDQLGGASFGLFKQSSAGGSYTKIATLRGGFGTTGDEIVFSVPVEDIGLQDGRELRDVRAFSAVGSYDLGAVMVLDSVRLR